MRDITGQVSAEFIVNREAAFDNLIGFYKIADANGGIDFDGNGTVDIRPGDTNYTQAALRGRVVNLDMTVRNQETATFTTNLDGGSIYAPFIIANGKTEAVLDNNSNKTLRFTSPFLELTQVNLTIYACLETTNGALKIYLSVGHCTSSNFPRCYYFSLRKGRNF